ncbi:DUF6691 family protein [Acidocella sp.]|uniref:DUF6691 family protein n=1 Tax=Acidocella sp. TaxID=50710 RepID=UPI002620ABF0|nr:DUF6691 family protein [Acidocella sp.]
MRALVTAFGFGLLFGAGLLVSGMTDPSRVKAFLDVSGAWNPALALVMGGAVVVALPAFAYGKRLPRALLADEISLPTRTQIDARLLGGAAIFGVGWGLGGICPGPGLVMAGAGALGAGVFVLTSALGARLADWLFTAG